jgi:hypothetical protein
MIARGVIPNCWHSVQRVLIGFNQIPVILLFKSWMLFIYTKRRTDLYNMRSPRLCQASWQNAFCSDLVRWMWLKCGKCWEKKEEEERRGRRKQTFPRKYGWPGHYYSWALSHCADGLHLASCNIWPFFLLNICPECPRHLHQTKRTQKNFREKHTPGLKEFKSILKTVLSRAVKINSSERSKSHIYKFRKIV